MKLKKLCAFILVLAIVSSVCALSASASVEASGKCGKNAVYSFSNGVLTISGSGETYNYDSDSHGINYSDENPNEKKWSGLKTQVKKVVVKDGITRIGAYSFYRFSSLTELVLPSSVKTIGDSAFMYCKNLEKANVAEDVLCETCAFTGCDKFHPLKIVSQPKDVEVKNKNDIAVTKIKVEGDGVKYQWKYGASATSIMNKSTSASGKSASYKTKVTSARFGRYVQCEITDRYGRWMNSKAARLTFKNPYPTVVTQPQSVSVGSGETAKIIVKATGDGLTYTWYYKNSNQVLFHKSSAAKSTYSIKMTEERDNRQMYCEIKDKYNRKVQTNVVTLKLKK